jgi:hypothetical protein
MYLRGNLIGTDDGRQQQTTDDTCLRPESPLIAVNLTA